MIRTQPYMDEALHSRLRELSEQQGRTISELVREALRNTYGANDQQRRLDTLKAISGLWAGRAEIDNTDAYVRRLRQDTRRPNS